jgi:hypothetical protein
MKDDYKKNITSSHLSIPSDYYEMSYEEQRQFLGSILRGMSPNPEVRATAGKKFRKKRR